MRSALVIFAGIFLVSAANGGDSPAQPEAVIPESGFIAPHQYTNAFFGFALSIPGGCRFQVFDQNESDKPSEHFLFGEKCVEKGLSTFGISATPVLGSADEEVRKAVLLPRMGPRVGPEQLTLHGKTVWKNALEEKTLWGQKVWRARYATLDKGFVLLFWMSSFDSKLAADLRQAIEGIRFFEPSHAAEIAGSDSRPYLPEAMRLRTESIPDMKIAQLEAGDLRGNVYVNSALGFSYRFPDGWFHSAQATLQQAIQKPASETLISASESGTTAGECLRVLASFTRFEEGTRALDFNPRTAVLAADPSCFIHDLTFPTSLEDNGAVQSYGEALARSLVGTPLIGTQNIQLFGIDLQGRILLEISSSNAERVKGSGLLRKIHSDMILTVFRKLWIIWLSESDSESDFSTVFKSAVSFDSADVR